MQQSIPKMARACERLDSPSRRQMEAFVDQLVDAADCVGAALVAAVRSSFREADPCLSRFGWTRRSTSATR